MTNLERSKHQQFPFHLVAPSPWPISVSIALLSLALTLGLSFHGYMNNIIWIYLSILTVLASMTLWFRDIIAEGTYLGDHTIAVRKGLNIGFILFVISEILIFFSLFIAYIHSAMNPTVELGSIWPPLGIEVVNPLELPLLNTIILLASGATITWSHHALLYANRNQSLISLYITIWLIVLFVFFQVLEYTYANFNLTDGIYGSVFYSLTGLHFLHMNMLIAMLIICYWRLRNYQLTLTHHVGYEVTILYLHVLDVIWLVIYLIVYWWGT